MLVSLKFISKLAPATKSPPIGRYEKRTPAVAVRLHISNSASNGATIFDVDGTTGHTGLMADHSITNQKLGKTNFFALKNLVGTTMEATLIFLGGIFAGILLLIGYGAYRAVNSHGWDDSNVMNWLRVFSHLIVHPEDFARMYYLNHSQKHGALEASRYPLIRPFDYVDKDEFAENFPTSRPPQ